MKVLPSTLALAAVITTVCSYASATDTLQIGQAQLDPPTLVSLGIQLLVTDDDNHNAKVTVRYRQTGTSAWKDGLPLFRVHPENVTGFVVPHQFAGSIFGLRPATSYELELHATDPDGAVDQVLTLNGTTRPVPADPATPKAVPVTDVASLQAALNSAQPGDVITLAAGTYAGTFALQASGTAENPIVLRGASQDGVIIDGQGCAPCNVMEVYGSYVHIEQLTLAHASRGLRFQGTGAQGNVLRRVKIQDVTLGIGSKQDQKDFYLCDNVIEGRLSWPLVYSDDGGSHSDDDGINLAGTGHVVCHNQLKGFGDAFKMQQDGAVSFDFYGNEILSAYDNGLELDTTQRNARAFLNRFTNCFSPLSFQPVFGGPAYAIRNVVVNVVDEQMKFHALGSDQEPSGMIVLHNTFVSPKHALWMQTAAVSRHFIIENNIFLGPASPEEGRTVDWTGGMQDALWDYDGFFPDGMFAMRLESGYQKFPNFAALQAAGAETHGLLLQGSVFASGLVAPTSYTTALEPQDVTLAATSNAVDKGLVLANINDGFQGAGPDLGALELGCAVPLYGVRPTGVDETNEPFGCEPAAAGGAAGAAGAGGNPGTGGVAGSAGSLAGAGGSAAGASGAGGGAKGGSAGKAGTGGSSAAGAAGSSSPDGGVPAGAQPTEDDGGCGCRVGDSAIREYWLIVCAALACLARRRGRKIKSVEL